MLFAVADGSLEPGDPVGYIQRLWLSCCFPPTVPPLFSSFSFTLFSSVFLCWFLTTVYISSLHQSRRIDSDFDLRPLIRSHLSPILL